jgi:hypothetical protein
MDRSQVRLERLPERQQPPPEPRADRIERLKWISPQTRGALGQAICREQEVCTLCDREGTLKRLRVHVRQHFLRCYCPCGYGRLSRDSIGDHQRRMGRTPAHGGSQGDIYESDAQMFPQMAEYLGWKDPSPFEACLPVRDPSLRQRGRPTYRPNADARARIRELKRKSIPATSTRQEIEEVTSAPPSKQRAPPVTAPESTISQKPHAEEETRVAATPGTASTSQTELQAQMAIGVALLRSQADQLEVQAKMLRHQAEVWERCSKM